MENVISCGCISSPPDERDYKMRDYINMGTRPKVYIPDRKAPVLYQGYVNSCVAFAIVTALFYMEGVEYSTDDIYHDREDTDWQGEGMITREGLKKVQKRGVILREVIPTNTEYPNQAVKTLIEYLPPTIHRNKILNYARCYSEDELCDAVYQNKAALISINSTVSFDSFVLRGDDNMILPMPRADERSRGKHLVCAMAFTEDGIMIQNSRGETWGNKGFAILPWGYPINEMWGFVDMGKDWQTVELTVDDTIAYVNGKKAALDVPATIIKDRVVVPIRFIAEALGCEVEYLSDSRKVIIRRAINGGNN